MNEGAHFTIDFVEEQHRQPVKMLMQILCIDLKQAYELFIESGFNAEAAIHRKTNPQPQPHHFEESNPRSNRGRGRRNAVIHNFNEQLPPFFQEFDDEDDGDFNSFPIARRRPNMPLHVEEETSFDSKFNKLLQHKRKKKSFQKNYQIRREITDGESIGMKIFNRKPKNPSEKKLLNIKSFFKNIEKGLLDRVVHIKFGKGSMSQSIQQCYRTFQPFLAYHFYFDLQENSSAQKLASNTTTRTNNGTKKPQFKTKKMVIDITEDDPNEKMIQVDGNSQQVLEPEQMKFSKTQKNAFLRSLMLDQRLTRTANDNFLNFIMDVNNYEFQAYLKQYFPKTTRKQSFLLVLRVNYLQEIQLVGRINLDEIVEKTKEMDQKAIDQQIYTSVTQQLKTLSNRSKSLQKEEDNLAQRYRLFQRGIYHYDYIKPPSTAQKIKIKEDQQIIRMQQEEFLNMQNQIIEQKLKELGGQKEKQKVSKQQTLAKRLSIRENMRKYTPDQPNVMMIKFRLPSGKNIILKVSTKQKVAYLFDYIFSLQQENIGFQAEQEGGHCDRVFDIIRPEDRISLEGRVDEGLDVLFEGSLMESLIVKEKE